MKDIVVKSGQNYEIHVPFKAYPLPNAEWMIDDNDVPVDAERIQIKVTGLAQEPISATGSSAKIVSGCFADL